MGWAVNLMKPRKEVTNIYWFPFRDFTCSRPVKSDAAQSFLGTVRVKGGASGSFISIAFQTASAVDCCLDIAGNAVEGGGARVDLRP